MTVAGLQVPGPLMGGPARMMSPNADWAPVLPIRQNAATLWYHANTPNQKIFGNCTTIATNNKFVVLKTVKLGRRR